MGLISEEGFLITIKKPDLDKLKADCFSAVMEQHAKGHDNIKADFRICFFRKKYLMISKILMTAVDRETNKAVSVYSGSGAIEKYIVAKWKFDHARSKDINWNVIEFECDGESVRTNTSFDEEVLRAAEQDVRAGVINRALSSFVRFTHNLATLKYRTKEK